MEVDSRFGVLFENLSAGCFSDGAGLVGVGADHRRSCYPIHSTGMVYTVLLSYTQSCYPIHSPAILYTVLVWHTQHFS